MYIFTHDNGLTSSLWCILIWNFPRFKSLKLSKPSLLDHHFRTGISAVGAAKYGKKVTPLIVLERTQINDFNCIEFYLEISLSFFVLFKNQHCTLYGMSKCIMYCVFIEVGSLDRFLESLRLAIGILHALI